MNVYVSAGDVTNSIDYFKNAGFDSDDMLFLFLLGKHLGVTSSYPVSYLSGNLSADDKKECINAMWMLAGLFDSGEKSDKCGLMFPTAFNRVAFYQPATAFQSIIGRIKDTIEKKNLNVPIYQDTESLLTLKNNYRDLINENYLKGIKISLSHLAAWVLRFTCFEFNSMPDEKQFTRVVEKAIKKFFKITKNDFLWLFVDDLSTCRLTPSTTGITGAAIRGEFTFTDPAKTPVVYAITPTDEAEVSVIDQNTVNKFLQLSGDNPSSDDILDILKNKKQIVLTGVPGVGKSRYTQELCTNSFFNENKTIQFHASYSYEDFIGAEVLKTDIDGTYVTTRKGAFLDFADKASHNPDKNYLFIIDELNRGNISEIFGETILALDRNYKVSLSKEYEGISELQLPENLYIVATMNTSDRNIAFLDLAIRRRFAFIPLMPNYDFLSESVELNDIDLGNVLRIINQRIIESLKDSELVLGQSYFIPPKDASGNYVWDFEKFKNQFNFVLLPTIREYSFNDPAAVNTILGEALGDSIQDLDDFKSAFKAEFAL